MSNPQLVRGDLYWTDLSPAEGSEQGGFRPVLILSNKVINDSSPIIMIAPLTRYSVGKRMFPSDVLIEQTDVSYIAANITELKKRGHQIDMASDSVFIGNQSRAIAKHRLTKQVGSIVNRDVLKKINGAISLVYAISACESCFFPMDPTNLLCSNPRCKKRHRKKCFSCNEVMPLTFNFCPKCGKGV